MLGHRDVHDARAGCAAPEFKPRVRSIAEAGESVPPPAPLPAEGRERLRAWAERFNARDFDALRDLLAEDVRLDLVNRRQIVGRKDVSVYFTRYAERADWKFTPGLAEGRPALLVSNPADTSDTVEYVVLLDWSNGRISAIHDFFYAQYVTDGLTVTTLP